MQFTDVFLTMFRGLQPLTLDLDIPMLPLLNWRLKMENPRFTICKCPFQLIKKQNLIRRHLN